MPEKAYIAIDLKSFYASVECMERGLDPMTTNLVVADKSRTEKTICLAVSPALKAYGISGRARLFEVVQRVREVNARRRRRAPGQKFTGASCQSGELSENPSLAVELILVEEDGTVLITPGLEDAFQLAEGQEREQVVIQP